MKRQLLGKTLQKITEAKTQSGTKIIFSFRGGTTATVKDGQIEVGKETPKK
jgi:hypothetical protein